MHTIKKYGVYLMGIGYIAAGINHFIMPDKYVKLIANFLPYSMQLIYISGVAEILCGLGLLIPATRKAAAWGTVALLIAISPAHINMIVNHELFQVPLTLLYLRLPLQLLLIWWAYIYTKD